MIYQDYAEYLPWLWMLRALEVESYLEIGTSGGFSIAVARLVLPSTTRIVTVDIQGQHETKVDGVEYLIDDSHAMPTEPFDAVFIDGDHAASAVHADYQHWWPHTKKAMGFHDISDPTCIGAVAVWKDLRLTARSLRITSDRPGCSSIGVLLKDSLFPKSLPMEVGPTAYSSRT